MGYGHQKGHQVVVKAKDSHIAYLFVQVALQTAVFRMEYFFAQTDFYVNTYCNKPLVWLLKHHKYWTIAKICLGNPAVAQS